MTISRVDEFESQKHRKEVYRGDTYVIDVVKEFKIELMVTTDDMLSQVIDGIGKSDPNRNDVRGRDLFISGGGGEPVSISF